MQKLYIENFGPIKAADIEINDVMLFIGPQASGKSTISKSFFFFKSIREDLLRYIIDCLNTSCVTKPIGTISKSIRGKFQNMWGPTYHLPNMYLKYEYDHDIFVEIRMKGKYIDPTFSPKFRKKLNQIISQVTAFTDHRAGQDMTFLSSSELLAIESEKRRFLAEMEHLANDLFADNRDLIFVPAGRSVLATLSDQIQYIQPHRIDYLMSSFLDRINNSKTLFTKGLQDLITEKKKLTQEPIDFESLSIAKDSITRILKASYRYDRDGEKLFYNNHEYTKLNFSSSGQQESIWILLIIFLIILENRNIFIVFEEPEAHLYPEAQKDLVELIALLSGLRNNQTVITTHSPYILASFNNLLYAHRIGQTNNDVKSVLNPKLWVNPVRLDAYFVSEGSVHSIKDSETSLIESQTIDNASSIINKTFDTLFEMDRSYVL